MSATLSELTASQVDWTKFWSCVAKWVGVWICIDKSQHWTLKLHENGRKSSVGWRSMKRSIFLAKK